MTFKELISGLTEKIELAAGGINDKNLRTLADELDVWVAPFYITDDDGTELVFEPVPYNMTIGALVDSPANIYGIQRTGKNHFRNSKGSDLYFVIDGPALASSERRLDQAIEWKFIAN